MTKKIIKSKLPFPLSEAILNDDKYSMEISGQIGTNPETGKLAVGIEEQTIQTLEKIKKILESVGWDLKNIIKSRVYLSDMENYSKMNEVYGRYFQKNYPTRVSFSVKELPLNALVEIECVASGDQIKSSF